jgi:prepilin-type N-terminal cleavage/methylation domain-containing protein
MIKRIRNLIKSRRGFTLIELVVVMSILGVLAAIVSTQVGGLGGKSSGTRLESDSNILSSSADRFFTDAFPQVYPVVDPDTDGDGNVGSQVDADDLLALPAGDVGVRELNFDAGLPQTPDVTFVPDFLKEVPDSAGQVSWRIDTNTGLVFAAEFSASLILPAESRLNVTADTSRVKSTTSDYTLALTMKKNEAAIEVLEVAIPAGYNIGGAANTTANILLGELTGTLASDNDIESGQTIVYGGVLLTTTSPHKWKLLVDYSNSLSTAGTVDQRPPRVGFPVRVHLVNITAPAADSPGKLTLTMDRDDGDPDHNTATENWKLTIFGTTSKTLDDLDFNTPADITSGLDPVNVTLTATASDATFTFDFAPTGISLDNPESIITNPPNKGVYRWLTEEQSTIDIQGVFGRVAGNQAVIITTGS